MGGLPLTFLKIEREAALKRNGYEDDVPNLVEGHTQVEAAVDPLVGQLLAGGQHLQHAVEEIVGLDEPADGVVKLPRDQIGQDQSDDEAQTDRGRETVKGDCREGTELGRETPKAGGGKGVGLGAGQLDALAPGTPRGDDDLAEALLKEADASLHDGVVLGGVGPPRPVPLDVRVRDKLADGWDLVGAAIVTDQRLGDAVLEDPNLGEHFRSPSPWSNEALLQTFR